MAKPLKVGDQVKVQAGEESDPSHAGKTGTVKTVSGTTIGVKFDGVDGTHTYQENDLVVA